MVFKYYWLIQGLSFHKVPMIYWQLNLMHVAVSRCMLAISGTDVVDLNLNVCLVSVCSASIACKGLIFSLVLLFCGLFVCK
jgi:hypothetical protein